MLHKLMYISQGKDMHTHLSNIQKALESGILLIQLRLKGIDKETYTDCALMAREICNSRNAKLIVNDEPEIAHRSGADGFHLGLDDMNVEEARRIAPGLIAGGTANTYEDIKRRHKEGVDYIGLGPYRFTTTKDKLSPVLGPEGYARLIAEMKKDGIVQPVFAIGGIKPEDVKLLKTAGVYGIAVSGMLTNMAYSEKIVKQANDILNHA